MHHHRIRFKKYHPGYLGKVGMRYSHKLRNQFHCPIVNIDKLWSLVPSDEEKAAAGSNSGNALVIDVTQFGYFKVLGKGVLLENQPVIVKAKLVSKTEEAGGAIVLTA
ncbi:hypothetical protein ACH5RR_003681 [Cinchona calisaya]|uniref:Large ribosomal subunit protein uL15/eL18 domain-containing protein n=1 Tax=Cinchona calisaya TaxID=153742 RepID=A0ABD3AVR6_9GENT